MMLNCGYELGEVIEMDGEQRQVVGEDCPDAYVEQPEWYPVTEPAEN